MRALNNLGIRQFKDWILELHAEAQEPVPHQLLQDSQTSYEVSSSAILLDRTFATKYEMAEALLPVIEQLENCDIDHECWPGIWDAISLTYFESICPKSQLGEWAPNRIEHYIYEDDYKVRHRHRVAGPLVLYRTGRESVKPFFQKAPSHLGEFEEQIGSRQEIAGNAKALEVLRKLYVKNGNDKLVSGYTSSRQYKGFKNGAFLNQ